MKTTTERQAKTTLPVSQKFYASLRDRIATAYSVALHRSPRLAEPVIDLIDAYLTDGSEPEAGTSMEIRLIFALLRPEIDRAIRRSAAARKRRKQAECKPESKTTESDKHDINLPTPNRRERRLMEQEERRHERRLRRRQAQSKLSKEKAGVAVGQEAETAVSQGIVIDRTPRRIGRIA